ncbi:MAG TPA: HAD-IA family hydrolase [Actinoplanes sp.]|jgi:sugar-phosphatase
MTQLTVDAVLFDLDGTLVDSTASVHRNWQRIAALLGRDGEDLVGALQGIPGSQVLRIIEPEMPEERVHELNQILIEGEIDDTADVIATKGAVELIEAIPEQRWGVVTSAPLRLATARLAAAGLPMPRTMVTADDVATGKPDPAPFLLGARLIGHAAARCLAIEDAPAGILAATRAGCHTVGVLTTYPHLDGDTVPDLSAVAVRLTQDGLAISY